MASSSSQSTQQAEPIGSQIDASLAAASFTASALLTRDEIAHAIIGGQAVRLLGNSRRTMVCLEAPHSELFVNNCFRTWTSWWMDQRLKLEHDWFNWITDSPSILATNWFLKRSVHELSHKDFTNSCIAKSILININQI